jgi:putative FmdB family regulatory protein
LPTYGYRCPKCANEFDVQQKMSDPSGAACPKCGSPAQRLFFPASIVFKGSGFYATDNRGKSSSSSSASSSDGAGTASSPKAGGESKTDKSKGDTKKPEKAATPSGETSSAPDKSS